MINSDSSIIINSNSILTTNLDGDVVILDTINGKYFGLDGVGARVWEVLETHSTIEQIKSIILDEYDVDDEACEKDIIELLTELSAAGLVIVS